MGTPGAATPHATISIHRLLEITFVDGKVDIVQPYNIPAN